MQPNSIKKLLALLLSTCLLLLLAVPVFAENTAVEDSNATAIALRDPAGDLLAVSKYGDTVHFPENSAEGIAAAEKAGADLILVQVQKTADGYFVLMADDGLSRMCVDALGNAVTKPLTEIGYHELSTCHLRNSTGSLHESITAYTVPTLQQAVEALTGDALLLLDGIWAYKDEVYDLLNENNLLGKVVFLARGDKKDVVQWLESKDKMPLVISAYAGNVIFSAKSMISKTISGGAVGTLLSTGNAYSVLYGDSVMSEFQDAGRAMIDMTSPELCGDRQDNYLGWNDVTARGYSIIITNNIVELQEYFARVQLQKERLEASVEAAQNTDVTLCSTSSATALKDALTEAKAALAAPGSENSFMESNYALQSALAALTNRTSDGADGKTITPGRIVAAILVVAALVLLEVVIMSVRRKKLQRRKQLQARKENNARDGRGGHGGDNA